MSLLQIPLHELVFGEAAARGSGMRLGRGERDATRRERERRWEEEHPRAFGEAACGPLYHARRRSDGSPGGGSLGAVSAVTVLALREPPPPSQDGGTAADKQAHEDAAALARSAFCHELRFLERRWGEHPNLLRPLGVAKPEARLGGGPAWWATATPLLVFEPAALGTLGSLLCGSVELPWVLRVRLAVGVASALQYLYGSAPAHAPYELHSGAVLVTADYVPKLCSVRRVASVECHSEAANVFHFGTVLWELLTRRSAADGLLEAYRIAEQSARHSHRWPTGEPAGPESGAANDGRDGDGMRKRWLVVRARTLHHGPLTQGQRSLIPTKSKPRATKTQAGNAPSKKEKEYLPGWFPSERFPFRERVAAGTIVREIGLQEHRREGVRPRRMEIETVQRPDGTPIEPGKRQQGWVSVTSQDHTVCLKPFSPASQSTRWSAALGRVEAAQREVSQHKSPVSLPQLSNSGRPKAAWMMNYCLWRRRRSMPRRRWRTSGTRSRWSAGSAATAPAAPTTPRRANAPTATARRRWPCTTRFSRSRRRRRRSRRGRGTGSRRCPSLWTARRSGGSCWRMSAGRSPPPDAQPSRQSFRYDTCAPSALLICGSFL